MINSSQQGFHIENSAFSQTSLGQRIYVGEIIRARHILPALELAALLRLVVGRANNSQQQNEPTGGLEIADMLVRSTQALSNELSVTRSFHMLCGKLLKCLGFDLSNLLIDRPRFRCTPCTLGNAPLDPYVYGAHRDTWFAEPEAQVNIWMSPWDVMSNQTFVFFPDYFSRAISNSSGNFDLENVALGRSRAHPAPTEEIKGRRVGFSAQAGEVIIFSAAHLHQTIRNSSTNPRYALQLRVVDIRDIGSQTASLRIDNFSSGSTLKMMRPLDCWINTCRQNYFN